MDFVDHRVCLLEHEGSQQLGFVRFHGTIDPWPGKECFGIEWDDPERGRNDGAVPFKGEKIRYFKVKRDVQSGSFLKILDDPVCSRDGYSYVNLAKGKVLVVKGRTLVDALAFKYDQLNQLDNLKNESIRFGSKQVKKYGFEKLMRLQANFNALRIVSLDHLLIGNEIGCSCSKLASEMLSSVQDLSLAYNMMTSWSIVVELATSLKQLRTLRLDGNWLDIEATSVDPCISVTKLTVSECGLGVSLDSKFVLDAVSAAFPKLNALSLSGNWFSNFPGISSIKLKSLDFSANRLAGTLSLGNQIVLEILDVSKNNISSVDGLASSLKELNLSNNEISDWGELDGFDAKFPRLESIKLVNNPILTKTESKWGYDMCLAQIMSRIQTVVRINGTNYADEQRRNYELYYISKVKEKQLPKPELHVWTNLLRKYGQKDTKIAQQVHYGSHQLPKLIKVCDGRDGAVAFEQMVFPAVTTVGKLKGKISVKLGISVLNFVLQTILGDGSVEILDDDQESIEGSGVFDTVYVKRCPVCV